MKKIFVLICVILLIITVVIVFNFKNIEKENEEIVKFNANYELYNSQNLNGLDVITVINKAISNNEKYEIPKDKDGLYILDDEYSVEVYVTMIINEKTYRMERISDLGINSFVAYFGEVGFKCTDVKYHEKSGRISSLTFEATEE